MKNKFELFKTGCNMINNWMCASFIMISGATVSTTSLAADNNILMQLNDQKVTLSDFENEMLLIPEKDRFEFRMDPNRIQKLLDNVLTRRVYAARAISLGLDTKTDVKYELEKSKESILARAAVTNFKEGLPVADYEKAAREYYNLNAKEFVVHERRNVSHVLIETKGRSDLEAKALAEEIRQKAVAGEEFADLALKYSDEPAAKRTKGNLGFFGKGSMVKPFEDAAFSMKSIGEISPLIKTRFGYHVIRLEGIEEETVKAFEAVKAALIAKQQSQYENENIKINLGKIQTDPSLYVNTEAIESLRTVLTERVRQGLSR